MATGRTTKKWARFYADGYDLSGDVRDFGPLLWEYGAPMEAALSDYVKSTLPDTCNIGVGALNGFFNNTDAALHAVMKGAGTIRTVMTAHGIRAIPAAGDPVFCGQFEQLSYQGQPAEYIFANIQFGSASAVASTLEYSKPWGTLIHANGAETAVNAGTGIDDRGAATALGGVFCYQLFSSNGTVTLSLDEASINTDINFAALTGATSGSINASVTPAAGMVGLGMTAAVKQYLRWQLVFGTATTATFAVAFIRI